VVEVHWHVEAIVDLDLIGEFIGRHSSTQAGLFVERVVRATDRLATFPESGRRVPEIDSETYREIVFQNYRIVYRLLAERVVIIGVVHAAMDMSSQAKRRSWDIT
jgi:plasmid stabilization system protein ParE